MDNIFERIFEIAKQHGIERKDLTVKRENYEKFGDINIAVFEKAKKNNISIDEFAKKIKKDLEKLEGIKEIKIVGGFVNIFLTENSKLAFVLNQKFEKKNKKILVEHSSINPNAPPHIGRIRNSVIGDTIARLLKFYGYKVETHYYVNDIGKQVAMLLPECKGKETFGEMLKIYQKAAEKIEKNKEFEKNVFDVLEKIEKGEKNIIKKLRKIVDVCVVGQKSILEKINISFDSFDYESDFLENAKEFVEKLNKEKKIFLDKEKKFVFDLTGSGLEIGMKKPVVALTRPNGTTLYLTRDLAYTIWKTKKADENIIVLGEDQKLYFKQLVFILQKLGYKVPKAVHYSMVLLKTCEGKEKMSTRSGNLVLLEDFFKEVQKRLSEESKTRKSLINQKEIEMLTSNIIRYSLAKIEYGKNVLFDLEKEISLKGNTALYFNYTLARAKGILRKLGKNMEKIMKDVKDVKVKNVKNVKKKYEIEIEKINSYEKNLLHELFLFPFTIESSVDTLDISIIAKYLYGFCEVFNEFYENCNIINAKNEEKERRILFLNLALRMLNNCFDILGLYQLERI